MKLKLEGVQSNRAAIGARIKVVVKGDRGEREIHRVVGSGGSFGASPLQQEIGLGDVEEVLRVEIVWPATGKTQVFTGLTADRAYTVREGEAHAHAMTLPAFRWPSPAAGHSHHPTH
jgi:hypothetical protein